MSLRQIVALASLQSLDQEIKQQQERKQNMLGEVEATTNEIRAKKKEIGALRGRLAEKEELRLERDRFSQDERKKADQNRIRMDRIKNLNEAQALQRQSDLMRQANAELEEEIIGMTQEIESIRAKIETAEVEIKVVEEDWKAEKNKLKKQIHSIDEFLSQAAERRKNIASQLTDELVSRYELIFSRRGGIALVEANAGTCQACFMNIPPQLWNEFITKEALHVCPSCQRFLYLSPQRDEEASTCQRRRATR